MWSHVTSKLALDPSTLSADSSLLEDLVLIGLYRQGIIVVYCIPAYLLIELTLWFMEP
jgi:hypothetical protein